MPGTFIDDTLSESITDVLYKATFDGDQGYIYLLIEHQRKPDELMSLRLLEYILKIFRMHLKKHGSMKLPLIYPVVLYNGKKPYCYTTDIFELFQNPELARTIFLQPFQLIDLTQYADDDFKKVPLIGAMELFLKHAFTRDLILFLTMVGDLLKQIDAMGELDFINSSAYYLFATSKDIISRRTILQEFQKYISPPTQEKIMTIAEAWIQDGIEEGLQRGLQRGLQEGRQEGFRDLIEMQIRRRFSKTVTADHLRLIAKADNDTLSHWAEKLIDADSIEDIFCS